MKLATKSKQVLSIVGCANGVAGRQLGCEKAANVLQESEMLHRCRVPHKWRSIVQEAPSGRSLGALPGVTIVQKALAEQTAAAVRANEELLVLGGDHSCAIGTWSGVAVAMRPVGDVGLIWVDAHMDAHTPESSDTGNIHGMPVAHLLGQGDKRLNRILDRLPKILPANLCLVGIRSYEPPEKELLQRMGVKVFYMDEVNKRGIEDVMGEARERVCRSTAGFGMSIDIDGFEVSDAPAVGTPEDGGIDATAFLHALPTLDMRNLLATEIVEFLPRFDDDNRTSERLVVNLIETIYATKSFQLATSRNIEDRRRLPIDELVDERRRASN
ncbi:hypothetical protein PENTCL1PPCAC_29737 [Pristionchus entomophagus]|uniref:Arginase n=1 Tax=Pristionchus entomophagus TaxID=358040 RepID=A0AAV5ULM6_9BILA|nr:hypothetical protein PENTCL1PPCAC_29737 [Pristionchus entomophagus]